MTFHGLDLATAALRHTARAARGRLLLIGVGGVSTGAEALQKIKAGASLVQVYSALAYEGPALVGQMKRELLASLDAEGFASVDQAVGADIR